MTDAMFIVFCSSKLSSTALSQNFSTVHTMKKFILVLRVDNNSLLKHIFSTICKAGPASIVGLGATMADMGFSWDWITRIGQNSP